MLQMFRAVKLRWLPLQCFSNTIVNNNTVSEQTVGTVLALRDGIVCVRLVSTLYLLPSADLEEKTKKCSRYLIEQTLPYFRGITLVCIYTLSHSRFCYFPCDFYFVKIGVLLSSSKMLRILRKTHECLMWDLDMIWRPLFFFSWNSFFPRAVRT